MTGASGDAKELNGASHEKADVTEGSIAVNQVDALQSYSKPVALGHEVVRGPSCIEGLPIQAGFNIVKRGSEPKLAPRFIQNLHA